MLGFSNLSNSIQSLFELRERVGDRLREARSNLKLKQSDLADLGAINRVTQASYESGQTEPNTLYLRRIQASEIDIPYVLFGSRTKDIARELGNSKLVDWKLIQQCHEDVDFFCLRFAPNCPASYRWQLIEQLYTSIASAQQQSGAKAPPNSASSVDLVSKLWDQYGK